MKTNTQTTNFLKENREQVINFFNNEIKDYWTISLKDFMLDLVNNFRKITIVENLTKTDLFGNLNEAKSRLGMFNKASIEVTYSKPYSESNHAKLVNYHGKENADKLSNL